ncbi:hypothetical protein [Devosia sp. Naph2]|uniref:hypothetical protein n=1 Tax=Devosia polycyclovorans TaxID=3345148 RepID=UPI0035D0CF06
MFSSRILATVAILSVFACAAPPPEGFVEYGRYYAAEAGETAVFLRQTNNAGDYVDWLQWGYDAEPPPSPKWMVTENLRTYGIPVDATAVRLHLKAKAKSVTWATGDSLGDIQVKIRPHGDERDKNEVIHAYTVKADGLPGPNNGTLTTEDLNHVSVDVSIGTDGRLEIYREITILGYAQVDLVVYISGYWK